MPWWIRPTVRVVAALLLPLLVPLLITAILWALPGNPVDVLCPPQLCSGGEELAARWNLDQGPWHFYATWMGDALRLDLGRSWRVYQGMPINDLMGEAVPWSLTLLLTSTILILGGSLLAAARRVPAALEPLLHGIGLVPAVILALLLKAVLEVNFGPTALFDAWNLRALQLVASALVLGLADGVLAGAVGGTRQVFSRESTQRYTRIALLRGETELSNTLPNVLPTLVGQSRARIMHVLSGLVIVEVVMAIPGLGDMLWLGTLQQDFGVVLAATWMFAVFSSALLALQAGLEIAVALHVRRSPAVPA